MTTKNDVVNAARELVRAYEQGTVKEIMFFLGDLWMKVKAFDKERAEQESK